LVIFPVVPLNPLSFPANIFISFNVHSCNQLKYCFIVYNLTDLSAPSYDGDGGGGLVNRSRTSHSVDNSRAGNAPNRMKPLPESLIFDMR
jgi:hypothetical protein